MALPMPPAPVSSALGCCPALLLLEGSGCSFWLQLMDLQEGDDLFTPGNRVAGCPVLFGQYFWLKEKMVIILEMLN